MISNIMWWNFITKFRNPDFISVIGGVIYGTFYWITKKLLKELCVKHSLYLQPQLNDVLYLHFKGFSEIENLEEYTDLKCLWLENNSIGEIKGLDHLSKLRALHLHNNCIRSLNGVQSLSSLVSLNVCNNNISSLDGLESLPLLQTLQISHNRLQTRADLSPLLQCPVLSSVDVSYNILKDSDVIQVFKCMSALKVLQLNGNSCVKSITQYRNTLIVECKQLTYLDDRPVFAIDRAAAEAWSTGGVEAENKCRRDWIKREQDRVANCVNDVIRLKDRMKRSKCQKKEDENIYIESSSKMSTSTASNEFPIIEDESETTDCNQEHQIATTECEEDNIMGISVIENGDEKIYALTPKAREWAEKRVAKTLLQQNEDAVNESLNGTLHQETNKTELNEAETDKNIYESHCNEGEIVEEEVEDKWLEEVENDDCIDSTENESSLADTLSEANSIENMTFSEEECNNDVAEIKEDESYRESFLNFLKSIAHKDSVLLKQAIKNVSSESSFEKDDSTSSCNEHTTQRRIVSNFNDQDSFDSDIVDIVNKMEETNETLNESFSQQSTSDDGSFFLEDMNDIFDEKIFLDDGHHSESENNSDENIHLNTEESPVSDDKMFVLEKSEESENNESLNDSSNEVVKSCKTKIWQRMNELDSSSTSSDDIENGRNYIPEELNSNDQPNKSALSGNIWKLPNNSNSLLQTSEQRADIHRRVLQDFDSEDFSEILNSSLDSVPNGNEQMKTYLSESSDCVTFNMNSDSSSTRSDDRPLSSYEEINLLSQLLSSSKTKENESESEVPSTSSSKKENQCSAIEADSLSHSKCSPDYSIRKIHNKIDRMYRDDDDDSFSDIDLSSENDIYDSKIKNISVKQAWTEELASKESNNSQLPKSLRRSRIKNSFVTEEDVAESSMRKLDVNPNSSKTYIMERNYSLQCNNYNRNEGSFLPAIPSKYNYSRKATIKELFDDEWKLGKEIRSHSSNLGESSPSELKAETSSVIKKYSKSTGQNSFKATTSNKTKANEGSNQDCRSVFWKVMDELD